MNFQSLVLNFLLIWLTSCRAFGPQNSKELSKAVQECIKQSKIGDCSAGLHGPIGLWNVSAVTDMGGMFSGTIAFNQDLSVWDVSAVTDTSWMFGGALAFNQDLSAWDVSAVTNMESMFEGATSFTQILCGVAWVNSKAKKNGMFFASPGSISATVCTSTTTTTTTNTTTTKTTTMARPTRTGLIVAIGVTSVAMVAVLVVVLALIPMIRARCTQKTGSEMLPIFSANTAVYTEPDETEIDPQSTGMPLTERTFATSNYRRVYREAQAAALQHQLLNAVEKTLQLYAKRVNPTLDPDAVEADVLDLMRRMQDEAFRNNKALQHDVAAVSEYLWTSAKSHIVVKSLELSAVLNAVIRDDVAVEVEAAATIFRSINSRRVQRIANGPSAQVQSYPPKGKTWRGGGFRERFCHFFESMKGRKYRVPGFLATSVKRTVASGFAFKADKAHPCALWCVTFDPRGRRHIEYRVQHMTFVAKTLIKGEQEYLFAPYSVFTLVSVRWSTDLRKPHEFTIRAARDNKDEDEDLPLAPWY